MADIKSLLKTIAIIVVFSILVAGLLAYSIVTSGFDGPWKGEEDFEIIKYESPFACSWKCKHECCVSSSEVHLNTPTYCCVEGQKCINHECVYENELMNMRGHFKEMIETEYKNVLLIVVICGVSITVLHFGYHYVSHYLEHRKERSYQRMLQDATSELVLVGLLGLIIQTLAQTKLSAEAEILHYVHFLALIMVGIYLGLFIIANIIYSVLFSLLWKQRERQAVKWGKVRQPPPSKISKALLGLTAPFIYLFPPLQFLIYWKQDTYYYHCTWLEFHSQVNDTSIAYSEYVYRSMKLYTSRFIKVDYKVWINLLLLVLSLRWYWVLKFSATLFVVLQLNVFRTIQSRKVELEGGSKTKDFLHWEIEFLNFCIWYFLMFALLIFLVNPEFGKYVAIVIVFGILYILVRITYEFSVCFSTGIYINKTIMEELQDYYHGHEFTPLSNSHSETSPLLVS